jgi:hypothetical protein
MDQIRRCGHIRKKDGYSDEWPLTIRSSLEVASAHYHKPQLIEYRETTYPSDRDVIAYRPDDFNGDLREVLDVLLSGVQIRL